MLLILEVKHDENVNEINFKNKKTAFLSVNTRLFSFFLSSFSLSVSVPLRAMPVQVVVELTFTPSVDKEHWQSEWGMEGVAGNSGAQARWINLKGMAL